MPNVLIAYASTHGHTAKIADRIAAGIRDADATPALVDIRAGGDPDPAAYDLVIAGASIHASHHQHQMVEWARKHAAALNRVPSAFFSVSLTAADDTGESAVATRNYIDNFVEDTGWTPRTAESFAGALQYREYDFATRLLMRLIMAHKHQSTDISQDIDYTDWDGVGSFANDCAGLLDRQPA
jgi:menaquinone-dependent protoporphyrinogen oxidase